MKSKLSPNKSDGIVTLERLSSKNAELVLSWRNSDKVRANSLDDRKIQLSEHLKFIENLYEKKRHFFVVKILMLNFNFVKHLVHFCSTPCNL